MSYTGHNEELIENDLSSDTFTNILTPSNAGIYDTYYDLSDVFKTITIENKKITGTVQIFIDEKIESKLYIKNCFFEENFCITQGEFSYIEFENVTFGWGVLINGGIFNEYMFFKDCIFLSHCAIYEAKFNGYIEFENSVFYNDLTIGSGDFKTYIAVKNCHMMRHLIIKDGNIDGDVAIEKNKIEGSVTFWGGNINNSIQINNNIIHEDFSIVDGIFNHYIVCNGNEFRREFLIAGGKFSKGISLNGGKYNQIRLSQLENPISLRVSEQCKVLTLKFETILHKDCFVQIFCGLSSLIFEQSTNLGTLQFVDTFCYNDNYSKSWIKQTERRENDLVSEFYVNRRFSVFRIKDSDLGKTSFISCQLEAFKLEFSSSKITEVFITGTKMPDKISSDSNEQKQLGYSQIKKIYDARGDRVTANIFFAKEMSSYYDTLSWKDNKAEKINLLANKYSTDHGQSWSRGVWTTLGVSCAFYILYCLLLGIKPVSPFEGGHFSAEPIYFFGKILSYYLEFINPIHKADYIADELLDKKDHISSWARSVEGISRIFIAYFVYQLIQAFRKHGKAS